jgi:hypothetical protein
MILVLVESPFAGAVAENIAYLKRCLRDCLARGESPYASHLFFTQFLDDDDQAERALGIDAGLAWGKAAAKSVVYTDRGISGGMAYGIEAAHKAGRPIEYRTLPAEQPVDCAHNFTQDWDGYNESGPIWIDSEICTKCGKQKIMSEKWLPMDQAPLDGREILILRRGRFGQDDEASVGHWLPDLEFFTYDGGDNVGDLGPDCVFQYIEKHEWAKS